MEKALLDCFRLLVKGELPWPLFLWGGPGSGKTSAALALLDFAGGWYWTAPEWPDLRIQASKGQLFNPWEDRRAVSPQALRERAEKATLVVLDEMGTPGSDKDWSYRCTKELIDWRYGKPCILISNIGLPALTEIYDARLTDRMQAGTVFHLKGKSRRGRQTKET